jgi:NADH-quinone oxidoreductase subunit L
LTLEHFLEPVVGHSEVPTGLTPWVLGGIALLAAVGGIALARALYSSPTSAGLHDRITSRLRVPISAARNKFYVDEIYGRVLVLPGKAFAQACAYVFDTRVIDGIVNGAGRAVAGSGWVLRRLQSGYVRNYALIFLVGAVALFSFFFSRIGL